MGNRCRFSTLFDHFKPQSVRKSVGGPAELARQNFSTAGYAHRFACAPSGPCPARVCKPSRSPRRRGAACLSARICVPRRSYKTVLICLNVGGKSVSCQILHEPYLSPSMGPAAFKKTFSSYSICAANQSVFSVCVAIQVLQVQEARTRLVQEQLCMSRMHQQHLGFPILWLQARCCSNDQLQGRSRRPSWQHRTR